MRLLWILAREQSRVYGSRKRFASARPRVTLGTGLSILTAVGSALANAGIELVYGGGRQGLMGAAAFACVQGGGKAHGIIPRTILASGGEGAGSVLRNAIEDEAMWANIDTHLVSSMHERKLAMATRSGAFIGLPGGFGTFEEIFEVISWNQLGIHNKPVIVLNACSYYEPLRQMIENGVKAGFIKPQSASLLKIVDMPIDGDWGRATVEAIWSWRPEEGAGYKWAWTTEESLGI